MNIAAVCGNWIGHLVDGKFPLLESLGSSEDSAVFLTELGEKQLQKCAIKLIPADTDNPETRLSRWQTAMGLSHPSLLRLFEIGRCEINAIPLLYVVMEYASEDLSKVIPLRPLTAAETTEMLSPLLDALSYIHERQLVHGHIKPSNIMAVDDQLRLSSDDIQRPDKVDTRARELTVYQAPEISTVGMGPAADVWSLGVTLVVVLTQRAPIWADSGDLLLPDSVSEPFHGIIRECLRHNVTERCTLAQINDRLQRPTAALKVAEKSPFMRRPQRRGLAAIVTGLVVLAILAGIRLTTHRTDVMPIRTTDKEGRAAARNRSRPSAGRNPKGADTATGNVVRGAVAKRALPDVPDRARNTIRGTVRVGVRVSVSPAGDVLEATLDSPGPSRYFASLARQAARDWKFQPPHIQGRSVASQWILLFQFGRTETQVDGLQVAP